MSGIMRNKNFSAFTLAEMMVVLLIMSIILAAMAPVMTSKMRTDKNSSANSSLWHWTTTDPTRAYLGIGGSEVAMIGQKEIAEGDNAKLILNNTENTDTNMITFKKQGNVMGNLFLSDSNIILGNGSTEGNSNIAIGSKAFLNNTTTGGLITDINKGINNVAIGDNALQNNTIGYNNIAIGTNALQSSTTCMNNIAIGANALQNTIATGPTGRRGVYNIAIGNEALQNNTTGGMSVAVGESALSSNTTGENNTAIGYNTLTLNNTGSRNTAIGYQACKEVRGSNKTCIGAYSGPAFGDTLGDSGNNDKIVFLGDADTTVYIPGNLYVGKTAAFNLNKGYYTALRPLGSAFVNDNEIPYIDGSNYDDNLHFHGGSNTFTPSFSDRRLKNVGKENTDGLVKLRQLKIFDYTFKKDTTKTPRVGVMAQDLQKVFPNAVKKGNDGFLTIRMEDMFYALINAVKELDTKVTALSEQIKRHTEALAEISRQNKELKETIRTTQNEIKQVKKENQELKKRLEKLEAKIK